MEKVNNTVPGTQNGEYVDHKKEKDDFNKKLSSSITVAIDVESAFRMYSYRIVPPEVYISRITEILEFYSNAIKEKPKKSK